MVESNKETVLITGITGFIGAWVGFKAIEHGKDKFKFRASVRDLQNKKKLDPLREEFGEEVFNQIEFVEADLTKPESLRNAVNGVQYILHVASPIPGVKNLSEKEMVEPAREGMKVLIQAAVQNRVKRMVVTSSFATIVGNAWKKQLGDNHYTEQDIAPFETADGYGKSKIAQEKVIRDFLENQEKSDHEYKLEIVTIHPTFVLGPTLITEKNSSAEAVARIMNRKVPGMPLLIMPAVDVRDVGMVHYLAMVKPGINGKRIIVTNDTLTLIDMAKILDEEFRKFGYRVQTKQLGLCPMKLASIFMGQIKIIIPLIGLNITSSNQLSKDILGMEYNIDIKTTVIDMGYSLIKKGLVPDKGVFDQKKKK